MEGKEQNADIHGIEKAKLEALTYEDLEVIKNRIDAITASFIRGEIDLATYRQVEKLESYPGVVEVATSGVFAEVLRSVGLNEETVAEFVAHEEEHFREIENAGLRPFYRIEFSRKKDGGYSLQPAVSFKFPPDISSESARNLLKGVIGAASDLSERDRSQLG